MSNNEVFSIDDQTLASIMNKRHRSAAKSFKSPPQPKFCIKTGLSDGSMEVFINVLSYTRIANQISLNDPIPLYGGMICNKPNNALKSTLQPPSSPQLPQNQLIFAVMASPEVLKRTGRNCPETPEQSNLVELMCEFVEAMNPGLSLSKKPEILKDRDLTGELKDIWNAVQNFREKEKSGVSDIVVYTEFGPESSSPISPMQKTMDHSSIDALMVDELSSHDIAVIHHEKTTGDVLEKCNEMPVDSPLSTPTKVSPESESVAIEKLSLSDKKSKTSNATSNVSENESSEKIVKVQNQKNKESHFFPKFLSKVKDDTTKEKDKEKQDQQEQETKVKTKKSLNFFRRNKSSTTTGSPTHNTTDNSSNNNIAAE